LGYVDWYYIVLYYLLITILFMLFLYLVHLHDSTIVWSHDICVCTFLHFTHSLGASNSLDLHIQVYDYCIPLIRYLGRITHIIRSPMFSLFDQGIILVSFYFQYFFWFSIVWTPYCSIWFILGIMSSCEEIYMLYCSGYHVIIIDWYSLFKLL